LKRPDGVSIIAIYNFIVAIPCLLGACAILVFAVPAILSDGTAGLDRFWALSGVGIGFLIVLVGGIGSVVAGWGLLKLKEWARWLTIALAITSLFAIPLGTFIGAVIIWYLLQDQVKAAFEPCC